MVCSRCGAQNPEGTRVCQSCYNPLEAGEMGQGTGIRTLFHDLSYRRTKGTNAMLGVFIALCVSVIFTILALAVREHVGSGTGDEMAVIHISTSLWVFLLIFQIAIVVLTIFRLDLIHVIVGTAGIEGITTILFCSLFVKYLGLKEIDGPTAIAVTFMVLLILAVSAKLVFLCIQAFTEKRFESLLFFISASCSGAIMVFGIIIFIVGLSSGDRSGIWSNQRIGQILLFDFCGLGYGCQSYWITVICEAVVSILLYRGVLGTKTKCNVRAWMGDNGGQYRPVQAMPMSGRQAVPQSWPMSGQTVPQPGAPGIQCLVGYRQGQVVSMQGEIVLGSGQGQVNVLVAAQGISRQHCRIRFEASQNCYYVMDTSTNGTYVNNQRIASGTYTACVRGSVVALADQGQQYKLL